MTPRERELVQKARALVELCWLTLDRAERGSFDMGGLFHPIWTPEYLGDLQHQIAQLAVWIPMPFGELWDTPLRELDRVEHALGERIKNYDSRRML